MSEFKGTPGPWFAIVAADGETYVSTSSAGFDGRTIAEVLGDDDESDENVNLIAAAPDLLDACEMLVATTATYSAMLRVLFPHLPENSDVITAALATAAMESAKAKKAIAKALGEQP